VALSQGGFVLPPQPLSVRKYDSLKVQIYKNKEELGQAAAAEAAAAIGAAVTARQQANLVFSTGASQFTFVAALKEQAIDWKSVQAFHLDEYVDMKEDHPASFRLWLQTRINKPFQPKVFHFVEGDAPDTEAECDRYAQLLRENPLDIGFIGIGENGHVAFNDPPVADFNDPKWVKTVKLDEACRRQQVGEGWFATIDDVPTHAITLTVPAIMACKRIISVVPDARKAEAVKSALLGPIATSCPSSILRTHPQATLFLDADSASLLS
jgi:glucosamine-6-phosphate deaminase